MMINIEGLWKYDDAQRQISTLAKLNSRMISDIGKLTKENTKLKQQLEAELDKEKKKNSRVKWVYDIDLHCYAPTDAPVQELMKHIPLIPVTVNEKEETDDDNERNA